MHPWLHHFASTNMDCNLLLMCPVTQHRYCPLELFKAVSVLYCPHLVLQLILSHHCSCAFSDNLWRCWKAQALESTSPSAAPQKGISGTSAPLKKWPAILPFIAFLLNHGDWHLIAWDGLRIFRAGPCSKLLIQVHYVHTCCSHMLPTTSEEQMKGKASAQSRAVSSSRLNRNKCFS